MAVTGVFFFWMQLLPCVAGVGAGPLDQTLSVKGRSARTLDLSALDSGCQTRNISKTHLI